MPGALRASRHAAAWAPGGVAQEDETDTPPGMVSVRKANAVRATSFSARSRCAISGAQLPTALIGSLQLRVLGPLKLCVVSGGGQAEKAQKAEADAALRAAIANTTAGRGVSDRSSLRPPRPFRCAAAARPATVLAIAPRYKAPASAFCAFSTCPLAIRSATGPRSRSRCGCIVSPVRALPGFLATCRDNHRSAISDIQRRAI